MALKKKYKIFLIFLILPFICATTTAKDLKVRIVNPASAHLLKVKVLDTPEQWMKSSTIHIFEEKEVFLIKFSTVRIFGFFGHLFPDNSDIIFINTDGNIERIFENIDNKMYYAHSKPIIAAGILKPGSIKKYELKKGNLLIPKGFSLYPSTLIIKEDNNRIFDNLKKQATKHPILWLEVASFYLEQNNEKEAIKAYKKALAHKETPQGLLGLALAKAQNSQVDESLKIFSQLLDKYPEHEDTYPVLSYLFKLLGRVDQVFIMMKMAVDNNPDLLFLRLELARLYLSANSSKQALWVLEGAPDKDKPQTAAKISRVKGDIFLRQGDHQKAALQYKQYLLVFPFAPNAAMLRRFVLRHTDKGTIDAKNQGTD